MHYKSLKFEPYQINNNLVMNSKYNSFTVKYDIWINIYKHLQSVINMIAILYIFKIIKPKKLDFLSKEVLVNTVVRLN